jgi:A/G-specific adenine glycosylase
MFAARLLSWYDAHHRQLPWRAPPGAPSADPYRVWLSEIMLQQTTVATVGPYFNHFVERWPTVQALAAADRDDVLTAWAGLGYYARARNLHRCAEVVSADYNGAFPATEGELLKLPGIGPYTAAAVTAIAFGKRATVVDGNVERVVARLGAVDQPIPAAKSKLWALADELTPDARAGDYAQAMMDLGATVCRPRAPSCDVCPVNDTCAAFGTGEMERFPRRSPKKPKPVRAGTAFWICRDDGAVLLRRRPETGLLAGMIEVPSSPWEEVGEGAGHWRDHAPAACDWRVLTGQVRHTFTHFHLELDVMEGQVRAEAISADPAHIWADPADLGHLALPTLMKKVIKLARAAEGS